MPGAAINAARISRPTSVRMGMFCRFGSLLESRPVAATAWFRCVWTRPSSRTMISVASRIADAR